MIPANLRRLVDAISFHGAGPYSADLAMARMKFMALGATEAEIDRMQAFFVRLAQHTPAKNSTFVLAAMDRHRWQVCDGAEMIPGDIRQWAAEFLIDTWQVLSGSNFIDIAERVWEETANP